jgi:hypothetical protein
MSVGVVTPIWYTAKPSLTESATIADSVTRLCDASNSQQRQLRYKHCMVHASARRMALSLESVVHSHAHRRIICTIYKIIRYRPRSFDSSGMVLVDIHLESRNHM